MEVATTLPDVNVYSFSAHVLPCLLGDELAFGPLRIREYVVGEQDAVRCDDVDLTAVEVDDLKTTARSCTPSAARSQDAVVVQRII